jgi:hypothetical protein
VPLNLRTTAKHNSLHKRAATTFTGHLSFPPDLVFPLLCPVREYEWLDGWECEMIYSTSGIAEDSCIFKTAHAGRMIWSVKLLRATEKD